MSELIVDTSILVDVLREIRQGSDYLSDARRDNRLFVHPVVEAELIAGARNRTELKLVTKLLDRFESVAIEPIDARSSIRLLRGHRLTEWRELGRLPSRCHRSSSADSGGHFE